MVCLGVLYQISKKNLITEMFQCGSTVSINPDKPAGVVRSRAEMKKGSRKGCREDGPGGDSFSGRNVVNAIGLCISGGDGEALGGFMKTE